MNRVNIYRTTPREQTMVSNLFIDEYNDDDRYNVFVIDADSKEIADEFAERIKNSGKKVNIRRLFVGPVIGAHSGPGTIGIIFVKK